MLDPETGMDPEGVKLRAATGLDAVDYFVQVSSLAAGDAGSGVMLAYVAAMHTCLRFLLLPCLLQMRACSCAHVGTRKLGDLS